MIWKLNLLDIIADSRRCLSLKRYNWIEVKNGIEGEMAALRSPPNIDLYHNSMEVYPLGLATDGLEMKARNKGGLDNIENSVL